jgi:alkyl hydroperoxide reductase subunit AhpC
MRARGESPWIGPRFSVARRGEAWPGSRVYFYPSAYTGGCNIQAHTFAVNIDKFTAAGATIIGVSLDRNVQKALDAVEALAARK